MTASSLIKEACPVEKGNTVLVHAAAGGLGITLCQLLKVSDNDDVAWVFEGAAWGWLGEMGLNGKRIEAKLSIEPRDLKNERT
ncbi:NADPH2:quinone reductase [Penicillium longicatenatum]|uniref:NADPH2:quinone reductase n=1 Tax=Penicillium longicatenatum TaxID=1561947 RepID=UPI0025467EB3|nr:NADPH2:quinone reductase [Penicillium longicatenatum]KAJ5657111.1 NADPH2:quinone reductase [Penicillium longicatenatum]